MYLCKLPNNVNIFKFQVTLCLNHVLRVTIVLTVPVKWNALVCHSGISGEELTLQTVCHVQRDTGVTSQVRKSLLTEAIFIGQAHS